jgi:hypothetical protein
MMQKFEMSMMGEFTYFLGFQVKQLKEGTFISQTKYTQDLLKKFGMKDAKPEKTPMGIVGHLDIDKGGKSVDQKANRFMIGSILYLCASRPDIMLSVCMCARFQFQPQGMSPCGREANSSIFSSYALLWDLVSKGVYLLT